MTKTIRKTAGELSLQASNDKTKYDLLEVGEALTNDILKNVWECIDTHYNKINEPEFCVIMIRASDPLIKNVQRQKFYAWPYLPKPRPEQLVFHYDKVTDSIKRLWSLPSAKVMATISEMTQVAEKWKLTKAWCDAFYAGFVPIGPNEWKNKLPEIFYNFIRAFNGIHLVSESEYLKAHRTELLNAGCNEVEAPPADPFDFSKIMVHKVVHDAKVCI